MFAFLKKKKKKGCFCSNNSEKLLMNLRLKSADCVNTGGNVIHAETKPEVTRKNENKSAPVVRLPPLPPPPSLTLFLKGTAHY